MSSKIKNISVLDDVFESDEKISSDICFCEDVKLFNKLVKKIK